MAGSRKYISISGCNICKQIPQKKTARLELQEHLPEQVNKLKTLWSEHSETRYETENNRIMKCRYCGTYYQLRNYCDTEDAFIGGPTTKDSIQRLNLTRVKLVLQKPELKSEFQEFQQRYSGLIKDYIHIISGKHPDLNENIRGHVIDILTDHFLLKNRWQELEDLLLRHKELEITLTCVRNLLHLYGESYAVWSIRDFTKEVQKTAINIINDNQKALISAVTGLLKHKNPDVRHRAIKIFESAIFYFNSNKEVS
ncbi:hypothetical protein ACFL35_21975 [Candidatus Riflebacteria bacterium]